MKVPHDHAALRERYDKATVDVSPPLAIVDLSAFDHNATCMEKAAVTMTAGSLPIRVASKSVRCRRLIERALARPGYRGVLAYTLPEAMWLVETGVTDDAVVGYPSADTAALARLAGDTQLAQRVTLMVDDPSQLDLIDAVARPVDRATIRLCLDMDASWRPMGGHVGVRRSPLHKPVDVVRFAKTVVARQGFRLVGLMSYEAQIAGVPQGSGIAAAAIRAMQRRSFAELSRRRGLAVAALSRFVDLEFVNAGGTGSLALTATDPAVTELTAGSGLMAPTLFDDYDAFTPRPSSAFALSVVRKPDSRIATVHGGGWLASGPADDRRLPTPWLPSGLALTGLEGAGEVQTPLVGPGADRLAVGDRVWFRHAKAGELSEHVNRLHLIDEDDCVEPALTYRGEGKAFL